MNLTAIKRKGEALFRVFAGRKFRWEVSGKDGGDAKLHVIDCDRENPKWLKAVFDLERRFPGYEIWDDDAGMPLRRSIEVGWGISYESVREFVEEEAPARERGERREEILMEPELRCSFCGKTRNQVRRLIAGPKVYICGECVELCNQIITENLFSVEAAVTEGIARTVIGQLIKTGGEKLERAPQEIKETWGQIHTDLKEYLSPLVTETVARLTCPHCGKRLDEPTSPSVTPSDTPLEEV